MININQVFIEVRKYFHENLPSYLTYHNWPHTLSVYRNVQHIARKEHVPEENIDLLKVAALFHDIGYIESKDNHEERGCNIMDKWLEKYEVSSQNLNIMKGMIMATKIPQNPHTQLEKIIADADLLYLGTNKFSEISEQLFSEFKHYNPALDQDEWNNLQVEFLSNHKFHTHFCQRYYEWEKQENLHNVIDRMK